MSDSTRKEIMISTITIFLSLIGSFFISSYQIVKNENLAKDIFNAQIHLEKYNTEKEIFYEFNTITQEYSNALRNYVLTVLRNKIDFENNEVEYMEKVSKILRKSTDDINSSLQKITIHGAKIYLNFKPSVFEKFKEFELQCEKSRNNLFYNGKIIIQQVRKILSKPKSIKNKNEFDFFTNSYFPKNENIEIKQAMKKEIESIGI